MQTQTHTHTYISPTNTEDTAHFSLCVKYITLQLVYALKDKLSKKYNQNPHTNVCLPNKKRRLRWKWNSLTVYNSVMQHHRFERYEKYNYAKVC